MRGAKPHRALEERILQSDLFERGSSVLVACSGGPDSVALAASLCAIADERDLKVCIGHVNHGLRASAWQDEAIVLRIAATYGIAADIVGLAGDDRDEAAMRNARYGALAGIARERGAKLIATAHTAEDQTETLLLALFRGTGPQGLAGIPVSRGTEGLRVVRPLLSVDHATLADYCHALALPYALDPTNADLGYRRNAVRSALEALRPLFPGLDAAVARAASIVSEELAGSPRAMLRRRLREAIAQDASLHDVDFEHVEAAVRALERGGSGNFFMSPGVEVEVTAGKLRVRRKP